MNLKSVVKTTGFALKKASPTIMLATGIGGYIFATVLACKATLKVDEVLDEAKANVEKIHEVAENPEYKEVYTEKDMQRDLVVTYLKTGLGLGKLFGPAALVGGVSTALIVGSHVILNKRIVGLSVACAALGETVRRMRVETAEKIGQEAADDIFYGLHKEKVEEVVIDPETGKEKKTKVDAKVVDPERACSPYAVIFDVGNPNYVKNDPVQNVDFITWTQNQLNDRLERQGWLYLNDARMALGYKPIPQGQVLGWICEDHYSDPVKPNKIDLGIEHISRQEVRDFRNGYEKAFVIDFNVDGPIIDTFWKYDKSNRVA